MKIFWESPMEFDPQNPWDKKIVRSKTRGCQYLGMRAKTLGEAIADMNRKTGFLSRRSLLEMKADPGRTIKSMLSTGSCRELFALATIYKELDEFYVEKLFLDYKKGSNWREFELKTKMVMVASPYIFRDTYTANLHRSYSEYAVPDQMVAALMGDVNLLNLPFNDPGTSLWKYFRNGRPFL